MLNTLQPGLGGKRPSVWRLGGKVRGRGNATGRNSGEKSVQLSCCHGDMWSNCLSGPNLVCCLLYGHQGCSEQNFSISTFDFTHNVANCLINGEFRHFDKGFILFYLHSLYPVS